MTDLHQRCQTDPNTLPTAFSISVEPRRDHAHLTPHGELDLATAGQLERELAELITAGFTQITIDLHRVEYLDSTGLHLLLNAHAQAQRDGWELSIIPGPPRVQRLFELISLTDQLPFTTNGHPA